MFGHARYTEIHLPNPILRFFIIVICATWLVSCGSEGRSNTPTATLTPTKEPNPTIQAMTISSEVPWIPWEQVPEKSFSNTPNQSFRPYLVRDNLSNDTRTHVKGELLVKLNQADDFQTFAAYCAARGFSIVYVGDSGSRKLIIQTNSTSFNALSAIETDLEALTYVTYAIKNSQSQAQ